MSFPKFSTLLAPIAWLALSACGAPATVSFATDIQPVLTRSCAVSGSSCHGPTGSGGGLILDAPHAYANMVNVSSTQVATMHIVEPSSAANSYLMHKLDGDMYTAIPACMMATQNCGTRMPQVGGANLSSSELDMIRRWIEAGAPNN